MRRRKFKNPFREIYKYIESSILCIRFPFLYPRNRWTGKHYNNWKIQDKIKDLEAKYPVTTKKHEPDEKGNTLEFIYPKWKWTDKVKKWFWTGLHSVLEVIHCIPRYTELGAMDPGWKKAFGIQMCKEIRAELKKAKYLKRYRIMQIKEKWGELRWYDCGAPTEVRKIIMKYELISRNTCICCGKSASVRTQGYILPLCYDCLNKHYPHRAYTDIGLTGFYGYTGNINDVKNWKQLEEEYKLENEETDE